MVMCDASVTGVGEAEVVSADLSDKCAPVVTVKHAAGCHSLTADPIIRWLSSNPWLLAIFFLIVGPICAFMGKRWFPYVVGTIGAITTISTIVIVGATHGAADHTAGLVILLVCALGAGILVGVLLRRAIWIGVGLVGIVAGFALGSFIYGVILAATGWQSYWGAVLICVFGALLGGVLTFTLGKEIVILATSMVGSYLFTRGLTLVFYSDYPSEAEMFHKLSNGQEVEVTWRFWLYVAIFVSVFLFAAHSQFQQKEEDENEELANAYKKS